MKYLSDGLVYELSYKELRASYREFVAMDDETFVANAIKAVHLACIVSFLKELPIETVLSDTGIVHELIHLLDENSRPDALISLERIRKNFKEILELV